MSQLKEVFEEYADDIKNKYVVVFFVVSLIFFLGSIFTTIPFWLPALFVLIFTVFLYFVCRDLGNKDLNLLFARFSILTVFMDFGVLFGLFIGWVGFSGVLYNVFYLAAVIALMILALVLCFKKEGTPNAVFNWILKGSFKADDNEVKSGDMLIGYKIEKDDAGNVRETKEPVYIPKKDRFVHTLVLGPTGAGKTSQILLPAAKKDIDDGEVGLLVLEPKGDFAEQVYALAVKEGREVTYFNPALKNCPYFNPLRGNESDVIENIVTTFAAFDTDSSSFFRTNNENLLRRSVKVLKRLYGDDATLIQLEALMTNAGGAGKKMLKEFDQLPFKSESIDQDNKMIYSWFMDDYFTGISGERGSTKTFEQSSGVRSQVSKLVSNQYLRKILNPKKTSELSPDEYIDFDRVLKEGGILAMTSNQGLLRDLSRYLGYFLILQLESAVFRRPGNENTRHPTTLIIDEFQTYANPGFSDMLTQGRSYRVACVLATQNRGLIGMNSGSQAKSFTELVSTNCRNIILFPGANVDDAAYYSKQFGDFIKRSEHRSYSRRRFFSNPLDDRESYKVEEKREKSFYESDIIYQNFTEVICSTIKDNSVQRPCYAKVNFIDKDSKNYIDDFLEDFKNKNELAYGEYYEDRAEVINNAMPSEDEFDIGGDLDIDLGEDHFTKNDKPQNDDTFEDLAEEDDF